MLRRNECKLKELSQKVQTYFSFSHRSVYSYFCGETIAGVLSRAQVCANQRDRPCGNGGVTSAPTIHAPKCLISSQAFPNKIENYFSFVSYQTRRLSEALVSFGAPASTKPSSTFD